MALGEGQCVQSSTGCQPSALLSLCGEDKHGCRDQLCSGAVWRGWHGGAAVQGAEPHHPAVLPFSLALVQGARGFLGPWEKSGAWPNISKGEIG